MMMQTKLPKIIAEVIDRQLKYAEETIRTTEERIQTLEKSIAHKEAIIKEDEEAIEFIRNIGPIPDFASSAISERMAYTLPASQAEIEMQLERIRLDGLKNDLKETIKRRDYWQKCKDTQSIRYDA